MLNEHWFSYRKAVPAHGEDLITVQAESPSEPGMRRRIYNSLNLVLQTVFDEQPIFFGAHSSAARYIHDPIESIPWNSPEYDPSEWESTFDSRTIQRVFYTNGLMDIPLVKQGRESGSALGETPEESVQAFIDELFKAPGNPANSRINNKVLTLIGPVGAGKSTFINYLLSSRTTFDHVRNGKILFVTLNLERFHDRKPLNTRNFCLEICEKLDYILTRISKHPEIPSDEIDQNHTVFLDLIQEVIDLAGTGDEVSIRRKTQRLLRELRIRTGRRIVIIMDNMDYIFFENDYVSNIRPSLEDPARIEIDEDRTELLLGFLDFIRDLISTNGNWKRHGLTMFLVLREDSYSVLDNWSNATAGGAPKLLNPSHIYSLEYMDLHHAENVLESRLHYLCLSLNLLLQFEIARAAYQRGLECPLDPSSDKTRIDQAVRRLENDIDTSKTWLAEHVPAISPLTHHVMRIERCARTAIDLSRAMWDIRQDAGSTGTLGKRHAHFIKRILSLSAAGFRDVMRTYRSFSWVQNERLEEVGLQSPGGIDPHAHARIQRTPNLATIVQILGNRVRYSEQASHFPNIFLAHDRNSHDATADPTFPDYWLLPSILHYLNDVPGSSVNNLLVQFCGPIVTPGSPSEGHYYRRDQVCKALTRLQKIRGARLVRLSKEYSDGRFWFRSIELTDRARTLLFLNNETDGDASVGYSRKVPLACDFLYLQLVIDDPQLPIPPELFDANSHVMANQRNGGILPIVSEADAPPFLYNSEFNYSYIVREDYPTKYIQVMGHKLLKLSRFLGYLKAARKVEGERYRDAWSQLPRRRSGIFDIQCTLDNMIEDCRIYSRGSSALPTKDYLIAEFQRYHHHYKSVLGKGFRIEG